MNTHRCCQGTRRAGGNGRPRDSRMGRVRKAAEVMVPAALLALLPKCPMCFAAYVALGTGFTLSYASAHVLLRALTVVCISTLAFCVVRRMVKHVRQKASFHLHSTSTPS